MALRARQDEANKRALLFGTSAAHQRRPTAPPPGPAPAPIRPHAGIAAASERESLEAANDESVDGLRGRVGEMRHLAIDLGTEVRDQNTMLEGMNTTFDSAGTALNRTIAEVRRLAGSGSSAHLCALAVFAFLFFFLIYLLLR